MESKGEPGRLEKKEKARKKNTTTTKNRHPKKKKIALETSVTSGTVRNVLLETDLAQERYRAENAGKRLHPIESLFDFCVSKAKCARSVSLQ